MTGPPFVVAIDGPAASGKGTLARRLAERFNLAHLDTGKLYRAAAFLVLKAGGDPADPATAEAAARRVDADLLSDPGLRGEAVAAAASIVGAIPAVRAALLAFQREFAARPPPVARRRPHGAVLDGRDIGSVVCPEAAVKLFLTADAQTRAGRRVEELRASGAPAIYDIVLQDLEERDARDAGRREAPLSAAPGAVIIDSTALDAEAVLERASGFVARALGVPSWRRPPPLDRANAAAPDCRVGRAPRRDPGGGADHLSACRDRGERMAVELQTREAPARESFAALLDESLGVSSSLEGTVVKGRVIAVENDAVLIDVGLKSEGRVPLKEFAAGGGEPDLHVGDTVEVFLERMEDKNGEAQLSREKARREEAWTLLEKNFQANERVTGVIFGRVKGGFTVDLSGAVAFLPGSQVDIRPVRDISPLLGSPQPFQILKMDRSRGNIVVSRRAVLEESRAEQRSELVASLKEGQILNGVVKNITDYGAFVDLGGVDGLLHVTDIAWRRINHPSEALNIGQNVKVQVIRFNPETQRISLGMKQLEADPWEGVELKYPAGAKFKGRVTNITDYGAFVELEPGVEGLVHVSEMSWTKKNVHPGKIVSTSQEVEVMVLDVDPQKRRISLGLKQTLANPWESFADEHPIGSELEGEVRNITEFGLFIGLPGDIDGMVHLSDIDWNRSGEDAINNYRKGEEVRVKVLDIDVEKERISLGIKQLEADPFEAGLSKLRKGEVVTGTVAGITEGGIEVAVGDGMLGFIRKSELSRDRSEQRPDRFAVGEKVDAKITTIDRATRKVTLSIKAREVDEEKRAMAEFGSSDSGASLGDILGAAINRARRQGEADRQPDEEDAG